jgi:allantoate deiminase
MEHLLAEAEDVIAECRALALHTEEAGFTTRTFLSEPMRRVHADMGRWMCDSGMSVRVDDAGNIRGVLAAVRVDAPVLFMGSHLDTVPHAGAFDGILGVVLAVKLAGLVGRVLPFAIEVIGFSEEEGVRFGFPFIGSRALIGDLDAEALRRRDSAGASVADAIRGFGLDPDRIAETALPDGIQALGYLEFHIEQGPVLESLDARIGVVEAIAGQSRLEITFEGRSGHAGTTPMHLRRDALAGAAEWVVAVEREARATAGLVATVGRIAAWPGASNVIAERVVLSLDVRHRRDSERVGACERMLRGARHITERRGLAFRAESRLEQPAVEMNGELTQLLERAVAESGEKPHRMVSGAGHDAMIVARRMPAAMLFLRSPGGLSHHPEESVRTEDVAAALAAGLKFIERLEERF